MPYQTSQVPAHDKDGKEVLITVRQEVIDTSDLDGPSHELGLPDYSCGGRELTLGKNGDLVAVRDPRETYKLVRARRRLSPT